MDYAEATDMMTAALRGFNMELNDTSAQHINDVYSELAAITASDTYEISEAMTRTASIAANAGMDFDTASVYLAEAIETTREAPENIGTALKSIVARFASLTKDPSELSSDLQDALGGETVDANRVEAALKSAGVQARDTTGQFRDLSEVFLELNEKWDSLDLMTQRYVATQAAGTRQQSRFIAMMQNYDRTMELMNAAKSSTGAGEAQFDKTLDSLEAKLNKLKNAWNEFTMNIMNSDILKAAVDTGTVILNIINKIIEALGSLTGPLSEITKSILSIGAIGGVISLGRNILNGGQLRENINDTTNTTTKFATKNRKGEEIQGVSRVPETDYFMNRDEKSGSLKSQGMKNSANIAMFNNSWKTALKNGKSTITRDMAGMFSFLPEGVSKYLNKTNMAESIAKSIAQSEYKAGKINKSDRNERAKQLLNESRVEGNTAETIRNLIEKNIEEGSKGINFESGAVSKAFNDFSNRAHETSSSIYDISQALAAAGFKNAAAGLEMLSTAIQGLGGIATVAAKALTTLSGMAMDPKKAIGRAIGIPNKKDWEAQRDTALQDILKQNDITAIKRRKRKTNQKISEYSTDDIRNFGKNGKLTTTFTTMSNESTGLFKILTKVLSVITAIPGPVLAIGAAFATVVGVIKFWKNNYSPEALYEKASKTAEQAAANTDRLKSSIDSLKSSLESLADMKEELDGLVAGTAEWTSKLLEVNQAVLDIVHNFPELMQYITTDSSGLMSLDEEGIKEYQNALNENLATAQAIQQITDSKKSGTYLINEANDQFKSARKESRNALLRNEDTKEKLKQDKEIAKESKEIAKEQSKAIQSTASKQAITTLLKSEEINNIADSYVDSVSTILSKSFENINTSGLYNKNVAEQYANDNQLTLSKKGLKNITFLDADNNEISYSREEFENLVAISQSLEDATQGAQELEQALYAADKAAAFWNEGATIKGRELSSSDINGVFSRIMAQDSSVNEEMIDAFVRSEIAIDNLLDFVVSNLGDDVEAQKQALSSILGEEVTNIDTATKKLKQQFKQSAVEIDKVQQENDKNLAILLAKAEQEQNGKVYKTLDRVNTKTIRKNIARELSKYTSAQKTMLATIGSQLESIGGAESFDIFNKVFDKVFQEGFNSNGKNSKLSQEAQDRVANWFEEINWENPIAAMAAIREGLESNSEAIRLTARELQDLGNTAYSSSKQLQYLVSSTEYSELTESIQDFIDANGTITGDNIRELAKESKILKNILDEDTISATGLGRVLTSFQKGSIGIEDMTAGLTALIGGMDTLQDLAADTVDEINNFDPGLDEGEGADKYKEWVEASKEFYKNAEYGNTQFQNYLKEIFGTETWDKLYTKYDGDLQKVEESLMGRIDQFGSGDMYEAWEELLSGKDAEKFEKAGLELSKGANGSLVITDANSKDMTKSTEELVKALMKAKNISEVTAREMVTDFKNYSWKMEAVLNANDLKANVKNIKDEITQIFGADGNEFEVQLISSQDIENAQTILDDGNVSASEQLEYWEDVARELGVSEDKIKEISKASRFEGLSNKEYKKEVRKAIREYQAAIDKSPLVLDVEFTDDNLLKDVNDVIKQLDNLEGADGDFFNKMANDGKIQLSDLVTQLQNAGFSLEQIYQLAEAKSGEYQFIDLEGEKVKVSKLEDKIKSIPEELADEEQYKPMADAIVKALSNLTIDFKTGQISYTGKGTYYEDDSEEETNTLVDAIDEHKRGVIAAIIAAAAAITAGLVIRGKVKSKGRSGGTSNANESRGRISRRRSGNTKKEPKYFVKGTNGDTNWYYADENGNKTGKPVSRKEINKKLEEGKIKEYTTANASNETKNKKKEEKAETKEKKKEEKENRKKEKTEAKKSKKTQTKYESFKAPDGKTYYQEAGKIDSEVYSKEQLREKIKDDNTKLSKRGKVTTKFLNWANNENSSVRKVLGAEKFDKLSTSGKGLLKGLGIVGTVATVGQGVKDYAKAEDRKDRFEAVGSTGGALSGAALGAAIGSAIPGLGTAIGGIVGATAGGIAGSGIGKAVGGLASSGADYIFGNEETGQKNIIERAIENKEKKKQVNADVKGSAFKKDNINKVKTFTESAKTLNKFPNSVDKEIIADVYGTVLKTKQKEINRLGTFIRNAKDIDEISKDEYNKSITADIDGSVLKTKKAKIERLGTFITNVKGIKTALPDSEIKRSVTADLYGNIVGFDSNGNEIKQIDKKGRKNFESFANYASLIPEQNIVSSITANLSGNVVQTTTGNPRITNITPLKTYIDSAQGIADLNSTYVSSITASLAGNAIVQDGDNTVGPTTLSDRLAKFIESASDIKDLSSSEPYKVSIQAEVGGTKSLGEKVENIKAAYENLKDENIPSQIVKTIKIDLKDKSVKNVESVSLGLTAISALSAEALTKTLIVDKGTALDDIATVKSEWENWSPEPQELAIKVTRKGLKSINISDGKKTKTVTITDKAAKGKNLAAASKGKNLGSAAKGAARGKLGPNGTGGETLTGELGQELVWEPNKGSAYLVGTQGPEVVDLPGNAVVWPADQTQKILKGEQHPSVLQSNAKGKNFGSASDIPSYGNGDPDKNTDDDTDTGTKKDKTTKKGWFDKLFEPWYNNAKRFDKFMDKAEKAQKKYETISNDINTTVASAKKAYNNMIAYYKKAKKQAVKSRNKIGSKINRKINNAYLRDSDGNKITKNGKAQKLSKYVKVKTYTDADGHKRKSLELTKAGKKVKDNGGDLSTALSSYVSKLDGYIGEYNDYQDKIDEINENIKEIKKKALEEASNFLSEIATMLQDKIEQQIKKNEKQIDKLSKINDTINDTNQDIIDAINKSISKLRQSRENEKTEKDLSNKRQQLAWLKMDSSGKNALEIKQLEEELADAETNYTDSLVDQKIDAMQEALDEAAEQRERQITLLEKQNEILQEQIDNTKWNKYAEQYVYELQQNGKDWDEIKKDLSIEYTKYLDNQGSNSYEIDDKLEEFGSNYLNFVNTIATHKNNLKDIKDALGEWAGSTYLENIYKILLQGEGILSKKENRSKGKGDKKKTVKVAGNQTAVGTDSNGNNQYKGTTTSSYGSGKNKETFTSNIIATEDGEGGYIHSYTKSGKTYKYVKRDGKIYRLNVDEKTGYQTVTKTTLDEAIKNTTSKNLDLYRLKELLGITDDDEKFKLLIKLKNHLGSSFKWKKLLEIAHDTKTFGTAKKLATQASKSYPKGYKYSNYFKDAYNTEYKRELGAQNEKETKRFGKGKNMSYKIGGLADYTGPAWLDGTPSKPELVLNQQDTANFIQLKDTLASLLNGNNTSGNSVSSADTFNVTVNVQEIANDYDVDKVIDKVKKEITKSAAYRNNNTISKFR